MSEHRNRLPASIRRDEHVDRALQAIDALNVADVTARCAEPKRGKRPSDAVVAGVAPVAPFEGMAGHELLDRVRAWMARHVIYPTEHAANAHVLWVAHTHMMRHWDSTPRIAFLSAEPGSGKSRALEVTEALVPNPVQTANCSVAYLFRKVGEGDDNMRATILFDEVDTIFGRSSRGAENEDLRGLLNAGHRRHSTVGRCVIVGKEVRTEETPVFAAVALAGLGWLPDTLLTRSVIIRMRRRGPGERVAPYRQRLHAPEGHRLRDTLASWAAGLRDISLPDGTMPAGVEDRDADCWEALIAAADAAGGHWPQTARDAAVHLVGEAKGSAPQSLNIQLLGDIRRVFKDEDQLPTNDLLDRLHALDESPWASIRGEPLDARALAWRLAGYDVKPRVIRVGTKTPRGYRRADFHDAWERYCPAMPQNSPTSATAQQRHGVGLSGGHDPKHDPKHGATTPEVRL